MTQAKGSDAKPDLFVVAVIGAGPVGLAAAAALAAVPGVSVWLFDRADPKAPPTEDKPDSSSGCTDAGAAYTGKDEDGRALEIWPNAVAALQRIRGRNEKSIGEHLFGAAPTSTSFYRLERYDFRSPSGRLLWGAPTGSIGRRLGRHPHVLTPIQLKQSIEGAVKGIENLEQFDGYELTHVIVNETASSAPPVALTFKLAEPKDGKDTETVYVHLVVGSDGAASTVRRCANEPDAGPAAPPGAERHLFRAWEPRLSRTVAVVGRSKLTPAHGVTSRGIGFVSHVEDARFGAWACPADSEKYVRWLALVPAIDLFEKEVRGKLHNLHLAFDRYDRPIVVAKGDEITATAAIPAWLKLDGNRGTLKVRLRKRFQSLNVAALNLIDATELSSLRVFTLYDEAPARADWFQSRVVLLGDAVHPTLPDLGQGCGLAFEDAEALARHLQNASPAKPVPPDLSATALKTALDAWVDERHARAVFVVQMTRVLAEAVHAGREPQGVRDAVISTLGPPSVLPTLYSIVSYEPPAAL